jgi:hypothetical protein
MFVYSFHNKVIHKIILNLDFNLGIFAISSLIFNYIWGPKTKDEHPSPLATQRLLITEEFN